MKIIKDPVHGYVEVEDTLLPVLDSPVLQRLRYVKQLGFAHLVYPGANHTRFEHSLGTMHLASTMCRRLDLERDERRLITTAGLLHDIGHGPFSHVIERAMKEIAQRDHQEVEGLLNSPETEEILSQCGLDPGEIGAVIMGRHPLSGIIHGDLDVDRMDYLMRDAHYTGVPYGIVDAHRLIQSTVLTEHGIALDESGIVAAESLLIARTLMRPAVYFHHVSRIAASMFIRAILDHVRLQGRDEITSLAAMNDASSTELLLRSPSEVTRDLISRLQSRNLYKRALYVGKEQVNAAALQADTGSGMEMRIAGEIAEGAGIEPQAILVDIPPFPRHMSMEVQVKNKHDLVDLEEVSPLITTLNETRRQQWRLGVYTLPEHLKSVEMAAVGVLNVKKPTLQNKLTL